MLKPSVIAWLVPVALLALKFGFRHFINRPSSARGWVGVFAWFAFDISFLAAAFSTSVLLVRSKAGDPLAPQIVAIVLFALFAALWVSFAAHNLVGLLKKRDVTSVKK